MDILEEKALEDRYLDLNEDENIIIEDSRVEHWRDVADDGENNSKIHYLRWDVYTRENNYLIKREFLVSVPHPKGGNIVWTCVKDNIIEENYQYKAIGLRGTDYKLFKEEEGGGI